MDERQAGSRRVVFLDACQAAHEFGDDAFRQTVLQPDGSGKSQALSELVAAVLAGSDRPLIHLASHGISTGIVPPPANVVVVSRRFHEALRLTHERLATRFGRQFRRHSRVQELIGRVEDREGEDAMSLSVLMARGRRGLQEAIQSLDGSRPDQRNRRAWLVDVLALFDELARLHTQAQTAALIHVRHLLATLVTRISPVLQEPQEPRRVPIHPLTNNVTVNAPPRPAVVEGRGWPLCGTVAA